MYEMFYELFKDSEYRDLDMFKQYIDKRRTEKEKETNKKKGTKEEGIDEDITREEGIDEDITWIDVNKVDRKKRKIIHS